MKNLRKLKCMEAHAHVAMRAYYAFDRAAMADGAIPAKYKELMALAVSFTTQCPYCIEIHSEKARNMGANNAEIAEAVTVAAALRAGAAITHGTHAFAEACELSEAVRKSETVALGYPVEPVGDGFLA